MSIKSLKECAETLKVPYIGENVHFSSISVDTRTLKEGELFIAIKGEKWDGHHFIEVAHKKKAAAIIGEASNHFCVPYLRVTNTRIALGLLAQYHRQQFSLPIVGVTGSCGKTTTKEYLRSIFNLSGATLAPEKSFNNDMGVPLTLLKLKKHHLFAVIEMGANAPFEIEWLTKLVKPTIAVIVNIAPAHLEGFGSVDQVAKAKSEIFKGLHQEGTAILPIEFQAKWKDYIPKQKIIYFSGYDSKAQVYAKKIQFTQNNKADFILATRKGEVAISLPLPGKHQINNALAATAAALAAGISLTQIKKGLESTPDVAGRLIIKTSAQYGTVIDDTYNANPQSVKAGLELLSSYPKPRILVLGDMSELGDKSHRYHDLVAQWAHQLDIQKVFTYGNYSKRVSQSFEKNGAHFNSHVELISFLKNILHPGSITLIKGSRSMQMEKIVQALLRCPLK